MAEAVYYKKHPGKKHESFSMDYLIPRAYYESVEIKCSSKYRGEDCWEKDL